MIKLIRKIIAAACDPNYNCTEDTKRETNLKNEMKIVRSVKYPWPDLTSMFLTSRESVCIITRKILDVMSECEYEMDINEVLCLCTSVTDQCVLLAATNCDSMSCEIVALLVDFIFEKNMIVCIDFLFWLDHRFKRRYYCMFVNLIIFFTTSLLQCTRQYIVEIKGCLNSLFCSLTS